jgi:hypothetical protein
MASFSQIMEADQDTPCEIGELAFLHGLGPHIRAFANARSASRWSGKAQPRRSWPAELREVTRDCGEVSLGQWVPPLQQR